MTSRRLTGKCFCGRVEYEVAFKPFAGIRRAKFNLIRGVTDLLVYGDELPRFEGHAPN